MVRIRFPNRRTNLTACLLAAALAAASLGTLSSCASDTPPNQTPNSAAPEQSNSETAEPIPTYDFNGYNFRFLTTEENWGYSQMTAEETGDTLDDATYKRNLLAEERLGIQISEMREHYSTIGDTFQKSVMANEDAFDAATLFLSEIVAHAQEKQLYPIDDLTGLQPESDSGVWNHKAMRDISISREQYALIGDINLMFYESHYCMMFNQEMIARYELPVPYELVKEGKWTFDKMIELAQSAERDVNGDSKPDPETDEFGIGFATNAAMPFLSAMDTSLFVKDSNGIPSFSGVNERYVNAYQKVCALFADHALAQTQVTASAVQEAYIGIFAAGRSLFLVEVVGQLSSLRGMTNEYGITIMPKYDEKDEYISPVYHNAIALCVPTTNSDAERTGIVLQTMAEISGEVIRPVYYDIMLGSKLSRDEASTESFDLILSNGRFETAYVYGWGDIAGLIQKNVFGNKTDIASIIEKNAKKIQSDMEKTLNR